MDLVDSCLCCEDALVDAGRNLSSYSDWQFLPDLRGVAGGVAGRLVGRVLRGGRNGDETTKMEAKFASISTLSAGLSCSVENVATIGKKHSFFQLLFLNSYLLPELSLCVMKVPKNSLLVYVLYIEKETLHTHYLLPFTT